MGEYLHYFPKPTTIEINKLITTKEHLMPKAKVTAKNPVDVTDWTREELVASLDERHAELTKERSAGTLMTVEEAYVDFRKRFATYNV